MKKEYFSIPNLMGYFRILMIPVFLYLYYKADTPRDYGVAFLVLAISLLTDLFDGWIARKFNMITDFGKALDPIADKLTQGALAIAVSFRYRFMLIFLALFVCKEMYMGIMGLYLKKKRNFWTGAKMYGKVCTTIIDVGAFVLLLLPGLSYTVANTLIVVMMIFMCYSLIRYILFHMSVLREKEPTEKASIFNS